mmetsp:Transcript_108567/g.151694  ORF Transcript_108567/g.151694 Transcript_108567/m.151694 type:complete len:237 (-) Transcript_108567:147-857(-)
MLLLEDLHEVLHHALVEVFSTQVGVAVGGHHLKDAVVDGEEGDIKGSTAEVVHKDVLLRLLVQTVCDGCSSGLVDDTQNIEASNCACILRGLSLGIVEIGRHRHDGMLDLLAQVVLGSLLHLGEHHGGHLLWSHDLLLALHFHSDHGLGALVHDLVWKELNVLLHRGVLEAPANEALHVEEGLRRIDGGLILRRLSDQTLVIGKGHIRGRDTIALIVRNNLYSSILVDAHARIRGA